MSRDVMGALLQHMRDYRADLEEIAREISLIRENGAAERERLQARLANIERAILEIRAQMEKPVQFTFGHLWGTFWLKAGFGIGMTIATLKLPDEAARRLFELTKLLVG